MSGHLPEQAGASAKSRDTCTNASPATLPECLAPGLLHPPPLLSLQPHELPLKHFDWHMRPLARQPPPRPPRLLLRSLLLRSLRSQSLLLRSLLLRLLLWSLLLLRLLLRSLLLLYRL